MLLVLLHLLLLLPSISYTANILTGAILSGSHLTAIYDVAVILADAGHNVTFISPIAGGFDKVPKHSNIHGVEIPVWSKEDLKPMTEKCVLPWIKGPSGAALSPGCVGVWLEIFTRSAGVFVGERVLEMFTGTKFDVIVGESVVNNGMALLGTVTNTPVVNYQPSFVIQVSLLHGNYPMLMSSQPSMAVQDFSSPPSLAERISGYWKMYQFSPFFTIGQEAMKPYLEKFGFSTMQDVEASVKLFLTNDHPAFTFPFLRPPNDIPIGCANLLGTRNSPLVFSPEVSRFLEESEGKDVVYISFGSYVKMSDEYAWFTSLMRILIELDLRIIVKADKNSGTNFPSSVLPLSWAPQKDLLRSGKVKLFISHCGNNGRIETIFYNVPVLCIPQFAEQPLCTEMIRLNGFGEGLIKEKISEQAKDLISSMLANHATYRNRMKKASDIVENEPGNVKENLVFYVEQVAEYKNVDYLVNNVIQQQRLIQIYNLDILIPAGVIILFISGLVLFVLVKLCRVVTCKLCSGAKELKKE